MRTCLASGPYALKFPSGLEIIAEAKFGNSSPWIRLKLPDGDQTIQLQAAPRNFGGVQWYAICEMTGQLASVLWKPHRQHRFASQQYWRRERKSPYRTEAMSRYGRAERGSARLEARLENKWLRRRTVARLSEKRNAYEAVLDERLMKGLARIMRIAG
jgi:hypothetical protein